SKAVVENETLTIHAPEQVTSNKNVAVIVTAMKDASGPPKMSLLRVLSGIGGQQSLDAVKPHLTSNDEAIRDVAVRALADWPDDTAAPVLVEFFGSGESKLHRTLALRGLVRLVGTSARPAPQRVTWVNEAVESSTSKDEMRQLLSAYSSIQHPDALFAVIRQLDNETVRDEVNLAAIAISKKIVKAQPDAVLGAMYRLLATEPNAVTAKQAKALRDQAEKAALDKIGYAPDGDWKPLFNGKDTSGWEHTGNGIVKVEDGNLIGTQTDGRGGDLWLEREYGDFELHVTYRVKWPANSGFWFRWNGKQGYQFDILKYKDPLAYSGTLYCPGKMFIMTNLDESLENRDGWNEARIRAAGPHLTHWLNGVLLGSVKDSTLKSGKIGVQIHGGNQLKGMKIIISDVQLRQLKAK
ncbi:MAG: DUF1080 domain-containing protein, partial [Rhodospirillales bacterium]|nr:DUF1080 domain-containing protein [Rhodospirillales bacterium]